MNRHTALQWMSVLLSCVFVVAIGAVYTNTTTRRTIRESQEAQRRSSAQALAIFCTAARAQEAVFREAESEVGQAAARAWHDLGVTFGCY